MTFPVNPAYASLNLSQAVLLTGYAIMTARGATALPFATKTRWGPAKREMVLSFFDYLEDQLEARGFFRPVHKRPVMSRNLRNIFHRVGLSEQDVRTLRGMVVRLVEGPREPQTKKRQGPKQTPKEPARRGCLRRPHLRKATAQRSDGALTVPAQACEIAPGLAILHRPGHSPSRLTRHACRSSRRNGI